MKTRVHSIGLISQALWLSLNISQHYQHHLFVKLRPFISTYIHSSTKFQHSSILWWSKSSPSSPHSTCLLIKNHQKSSKSPKFWPWNPIHCPFFIQFFMAKTNPSWPLLAPPGIPPGIPPGAEGPPAPAKRCRWEPGLWRWCWAWFGYGRVWVKDGEKTNTYTYTYIYIYTYTYTYIHIYICW